MAACASVRAALATISFGASVALLAACGGSTEPPGDPLAWQGTVESVGSVTTVSNATGQVWASLALVEEASVGVLEGEDHYVFGDVASTAVDADQIYVLDRMAQAVRVYDLDGRHRFDIGQPGEGPGEFVRPWVLGLASNSRLLVRDLNQSRMHEFSAITGELIDDWPASGAAPTTITPDGRAFIYTRQPGRNADGSVNWAMVDVGPDGPGDTVLLPRTVLPSFVTGDRRGVEMAVVRGRARGLAFGVHLTPFAPQRVWSMGGDGTLVLGEGVDYRFWMRALDGTEIRTGRDLDPVPLGPAESDWYRDRLTAFWREIRPDFVWSSDMPAVKRAYLRITRDVDGRTWLLRELAGVQVVDCDAAPEDLEGYLSRPCWRQPYVFDVFGPDGRFLASVDLPDMMRPDLPPYVDGNAMIGVAEDAAGAVMVKRYRLVIER
jgi:hypothetical protein